MAMAENLESNINPLDHFFKMLKINMEQLNSEDQDYNMIEKMLKHCHGPTHNKFLLKLQSVFKVEKYLEREKFYPFKSLPNRSTTFFFF